MHAAILHHDGNESWSTFDAKLKLLLVIMPNSEQHGLAAHVLEEIFLDAVQEIGMKRSLKKTGSRAC